MSDETQALQYRVLLLCRDCGESLFVWHDKLLESVQTNNWAYSVDDAEWICKDCRNVVKNGPVTFSYYDGAVHMDLGDLTQSVQDNGDVVVTLVDVLDIKEAAREASKRDEWWDFD